MSSRQLDKLKYVQWTTGQWAMTDTLTPISSLQERYGLSSRQAVYDRINAMKIEPAARGKLSSGQLDKLDELDKHIKAGGKIDDFAQPVTAEVQQVQSMPVDNEKTPAGQLDKVPPAPDNFIELVREIAAALKPPAPPMEPLLYLKELERAAAAGWLLTTDQVKQLIGVKPMAKKGDHSFTRGSFSFVKAGKIGSSTAWKVLKKVVE